jgi:hypothetical protein
MIAESSVLPAQPRISFTSCAIATSGLSLLAVVVFTKIGGNSIWPGLVGLLSAVGGGLGVLVGLRQLSMSGWKTLLVALWGILGVISPFFGWVVFLPWTVMLFTAPLILWILNSR